MDMDVFFEEVNLLLGGWSEIIIAWEMMMI